MIRALLSVFVFSPLLSLSWGKEGRHLTVSIAKGLLAPEVVSMVDHYLGGMSWVDASDWLEKTTNAQNASYRASWHRVLVPRDKTYVPTKTPNLLNQIEYDLMVLEKRSVFPFNSVAEAIKTLFALIPEAHQPLRCGYTEDKGGSAVHVSVKGRTTTFLRLLDEDLLRLKPCDMWDLSKIIMNMPGKTKTGIESATPLTWITESRALLNDHYLNDKAEVTDAYLDKASAMAKQQLVRAGIRLAAILNKHFKG